MYIPSYFKQENKDELISYMQQFPFGILVSAKENLPVATHVPFITETGEEGLVLYTHISAANRQGDTLGSEKVLVVFREPHAYISPFLYDQVKSVPTWNYVAVHAYGYPELVEQKEERIRLLEKMIQAFEPAYMERWKQLPEDYIQGHLQGITAIKIKVTELYGSEKLSQNKTDTEIKRISEQLLSGKDSLIRETGRRMAEKIEKTK